MFIIFFQKYSKELKFEKFSVQLEPDVIVIIFVFDVEKRKKHKSFALSCGVSCFKSL